LLEAQARKDLESDGCPACYPLHLDVPVRNPPEKYRLIIGYWQSFSSTGDVVLCAQRSDWRNFRAFQVRVRGRYRKEQFSVFVDEVWERRRRYGLGDGVHLLVDLQRQGQQENWIEFQNYHLKRHKRLEKKRDGLKKAGDAATIDSGRAAENEEAMQRHLDYAERTLRWHEVFLGWTEQQRLAMDQWPPTPIEEDSDDRNARIKGIHSSAPVEATGHFRDPPQGQGVETHAEESEHAGPNVQGCKIRAYHRKLGRRDTEQHSASAEASRDEASTCQRNTAWPTLSTESVQGKTNR